MLYTETSPLVSIHTCPFVGLAGALALAALLSKPAPSNMHGVSFSVASFVAVTSWLQPMYPLSAESTTL